MKTTLEINQVNKNSVLQFWETLKNTAPSTLPKALQRHVNSDLTWHGHAPLGSHTGLHTYLNQFWIPLLHSFKDMKRHIHIFFGGESNGRRDATPDGRMWVTGTGLFSATFQNDYLSIPASGKRVDIRWGEFFRIDNGKISEIYFLLDLVDLMQQAGFEVLPPSRGRDGVYPPPLAGDGVLKDSTDSRKSAHSLDHIRRFIFDGLNRYDQSELTSMGIANFFRPDVKWYGPGGIGACVSLNQFEALHQQPWLTAFPDRSVQDLTALIAEGCYSGAPGWAGVLAHQTGDYLDCPATGNQVEINGLDWWKRDGEMFIENWVFVDMVHLFRQMGVDLFERLERLKTRGAY